MDLVSILCQQPGACYTAADGFTLKFPEKPNGAHLVLDRTVTEVVGVTEGRRQVENETGQPHIQTPATKALWLRLEKYHDFGLT